LCHRVEKRDWSARVEKYFSPEVPSLVRSVRCGMKLSEYAHRGRGLHLHESAEKEIPPEGATEQSMKQDFEGSMRVEVSKIFDRGRWISTRDAQVKVQAAELDDVPVDDRMIYALPKPERPIRLAEFSIHGAVWERRCQRPG
jgi:hypothetical protein